MAVALSTAMIVSGAYAQSGAGSIQGTVTDPTGAVVQNAAVHVVNQATGVAADTKTNGAGFYQVPELFTGTYTVTISAPNMKTSAQTLELLVAQNAEINVTLQAGAVTQQVTVSANTVQLQTTDNGAITSTLENARINELPMNGRNIITLVNETTPGLESCPESSSCANGQEGPALEYEVDGATITNREFGGVHQGQTQMIDPDAIQEVRVEDAAAGAQYASPATAILQSKSGTNQFHGSLFETARNNDFGIARSRSNPSNYVQPEYIRNEWGASIGGPISIPKLYSGKNRTFFFFAYERYSLAQNPYQNETVPTVQMQNGDFSGAFSSSGILQELYDPATTGIFSTSACPQNNPPTQTNPNPAPPSPATYVNAYCRETFTQEYSEGPGSGPANCDGDTNCIPASEEAALTKTLNAMTPSATGQYGVLNSNNPLVSSNYSGNVRELNIEPQINVRLDQVFNENNRMYLRYSQGLSTSIAPRNDPVNEQYTLPATAPGGTALPYAASGIANTPSNLYTGALGYTHIFSPTFYSETVLSQSWYGEHNLAGGTPTADFESELGLPNNFGEQGYPYIESIFEPQDGTQFQYSVTTTTYDADENLTKTLGKHQLLFGGRYRFEHMGSIPDEIKDSETFGAYLTSLLSPTSLTSSAATAYTNSGQLNADEFLGGVNAYGVNLEPPYEHLHDMELDAYIQDNWRVRNNLTVNLGLRWEAHPAAWFGQGAMFGFDLKNDAMVTSGSLSQLESEGLTTAAIVSNDINDDAKFETPQQAGLPPMLVNNYNLTFSPRVGLAWQPFGKAGTVLRGAVGRYIYPIPVREGYREIERANPFAVGYSESYTSSTYTPHSNYMMLAPQDSSSTYNYNTVTPSTAFGANNHNSSGTTGAYVATPGTPIMGLNSTNVVNSTTTTAITPGWSPININPDYPPTYVDEGDFTIEQPLKWNSVLRVSYLYTHGTNLNNYFYYNDHPSAYTWEIQQGAPPPNSASVGVYNSSTGEGPYDKTTYGSGAYQINKSGWSNYNALQLVYQKLYHSGAAWQIQYVFEKNLRTGGDYGGENADDVEPYANFANSFEGTYALAGTNTVTVSPIDSVSLLPGPPNLPPPPPTGTLPWQYYKALNRWENYMVDTNTPPQHLQFNGLVDFPFGRGKRWLGNVNRPMDELVGGWQLAGAGRITITNFQILTTNWGPTNPLVRYKKHAPITDCTSGNCVKAYEWFNGYIAPTANANNGCSAATGTKVVNGLPGSWQPYEEPLDTYCTATSHDTDFGDNYVAMNGVTGLASPGASAQGANTQETYGIVPSTADNGPSEGTIDVTNPFGHTVLNGPAVWSADASLFKVFPIKESMNVRVNVDAFNVFNVQGLPNPSGTTGEVCYTPGGLGCNSANGARQLQFTLRFNY